MSSVCVDPPYILCFIFERDDKLLHLEEVEVEVGGSPLVPQKVPSEGS